jgi:hypothetical protein
MAFPINPINGQTTTTNNITYVYNSSNTAWVRQTAFITLSTASGSGGTAASGTGTTTTFVITNVTQSTSTNTGALVVDGGIGVWGNVNIGGTVTGGGIRATTTSTPPSSPTIGDIWYQQGTDIVFRYENDGTTTSNYWVDIAGPTVVVSSGTVSGSSGGGTFTGGIVANATTFSNTVSMSTTLIVGSGNTNTGTTVSFEVLGTDAILLPVGTTAQRPASPAVGMIRYNTSSTLGLEVFVASSTSSYIGTWTSIITPIYTINYLVIAGGGGGGGYQAGGGGAGGVQTGTITVIAGQQYNVTVGAGGPGGPSITNTISDTGISGSNSSFGLYITSLGGGAGSNGQNGISGGSGGGSGSVSGETGGSGTAGQGYSGGNAGPGYQCGGGGGAGGPGGNGNGPSNAGGVGGTGTVSAIYSGTNVYYAGGGGGGNGGPGSTGGTGGLGGGGSGSGANVAGGNATPNTGGGGGGGGNAANGGNGSGGIVILSYANGQQRATGGLVTTYLLGGTQMWVHTFTTSTYFIA